MSTHRNEDYFEEGPPPSNPLTMPSSDPPPPIVASDGTAAAPGQHGNGANNNVAVVASLATTRSIAQQPEIIGDDIGPDDPPAAILEEALDASAGDKRAAFRPELIDSAGPAPPGDVMAEASLLAHGTRKTTAASIIREQASGAGVRLELMDDHGPLNSADLQDDTMVNKKMRAGRSDEIVPSREEIEDEGEIETGRSGSSFGPVDTDDFVDEFEQLGIQEGTEDANSTNTIVARPNAAPAATAAPAETILTATVRPAIPDDGHPPELEAYPVDDFLVIPVPLLPLWKQRRVRLLVCLVVAIVVALGVALGAARSSNRGTVAAGAITSSPTTFPSAWPSFSVAPSSSPSSCAYTISSNAKKVDFRFINAQQNLRVAVDGTNMVVSIRDFKLSTVYTIFYGFENGEWVMKNSFSRANDGLGFALVALSGKTAFVSVFTLLEGTVSVYEQNDFEFWEEVIEPFVDTNFWSFGAYAGVGSKVACVGDFWGGNMFLFRRDGNNKWVQRELVVRGVGCTVAGNTIGVAIYLSNDHLIDIIQQNDHNRTIDAFFQLYEYDEDIDEFMLLQDPIPASVNGGALSQDHAVYSDWKERDVSIYHRGESNETYTFLQQLNISSPGDMLALSTLALDENILVVRGDNHTHIFSKQNAYWEEIITLDEPFDSVELTGYNLLATKGSELYSFDIQGCVPTLAQMPAVSNTSSIPPTTCYWIDITILYDKWPYNQETSWELLRIGDSGDAIDEVKSHSVEIGDVSHTDSLSKESLCLAQGQYEFKIYDMENNGMGEGHYNITAANGALIAEGGEFEREESTRFSIPFGPAPSAVPFIGDAAPSSSLSGEYPSTSPESSASSQKEPTHEPTRSKLASTGPTTVQFAISQPAKPTSQETQQHISTLNAILSTTPLHLPDYKVSVSGYDITVTEAECHDLGVQDIYTESDTQPRIRVDIYGVQASCSLLWEVTFLGIKGLAVASLAPTSSIEMHVNISQNFDTDSQRDVDINSCTPSLHVVDAQVDVDSANEFIVGIVNSLATQFSDEIEDMVATELEESLCDVFSGLGGTFEEILIALSEEIEPT